jgi:hypothetical protein
MPQLRRQQSQISDIELIFGTVEAEKIQLTS